MLFLIRAISFTWGQDTPSLHRHHKKSVSLLSPLSLTLYLHRSSDPVPTVSKQVDSLQCKSPGRLTCSAMSHLFPDVLPQLSQDLVEDDELTNQSLGVVT